MNINHYTKIDKNAVAESFSKAAKYYDQFAMLQRDIGISLLSKIDSRAFTHILDLGCGTGYFSEKLYHNNANALITCFDLSPAMLDEVAAKGLPSVKLQQGDIDDLPFAVAQYDLIFSNLVLQWSEDLSNCLTQLKKILAVNGKLYFSTLLDGSLHELTQAWKQVDDLPHTNRFITLAEIRKVVGAIGFTHVTIKTETRVLEYDNVMEVMRALKGIGANHVHGHQGTTIKGRRLIEMLEQGYVPFY
ncbi:malonyl-ACP O-methyltransferase BioC [Psychromonas sp. MME2]|uniref:malonyl-ACP O-methyltransferase BioC n=1 Tax=Psychromonas sp. MME2 TaxID=3231033 RepID=UPI00339BA673